MTINEYQQLAMTTLNPALSKKDVLINGVMGLCGEAGETIDLVKKHLAQGHPLDREKMISELGDVAWYLAETATALDVPLEEDSSFSHAGQSHDTQPSANKYRQLLDLRTRLESSPSYRKL